MSDTSLNTIIQYGTNAERIAFTPDPAVGSQVLYIWFETDNSPDTYVWNGVAWVLINAAIIANNNGNLNVIPEDSNNDDVILIPFSSELAKTNQSNIFADRQSFKGQYNAVPFDNGNSGVAKTINWDNGSIQFLTLDNACTLTLTNPVDGGRYILATDGNFTITWPASVEWPNGGTTPTPGTGQNLYVLLYWAAFSKYMAAASVDYTL